MPCLTTEFSKRMLAWRSFIAQPASLIRRRVWETARGLDESLHLALDYDLWWRLTSRGEGFLYVKDFVANARRHEDAKTSLRRRDHVREARDVVRRYNGSVPIKWYLPFPAELYLKACLWARPSRRA
jgi:hypothetical protein